MEVTRANVNARDSDGNSPLHHAVRKGSKAVITLLLSSGANVDVKTEDNITPLHIAAMNGYISIAEDLLNHGACINSLTLKEGYTPLHFASEVSSMVNNEETVKFFLNRGADINASTKDNLTPLHIATKAGNGTLVKLLLQHGAKVDNQDKDGKTILHLAVEKGNLMIVEDVLKYGPDINNQSNRRSLTTAVYGNERQYKMIIKALLEYGLVVSPLDTNNPKLLHVAVEKGYLQIVEDLLKYGADVNTLHNSISKYVTPLHSAAINKHEEVAKLLISYGANMDAQDETGKTPIFYAIENSDVKIAELFLTNGANVKENPELLHVAVKKKCIEIIEALLQHDVDINTTDEYGRTALHITAMDEIMKCDSFRSFNINIKEEIVKLLLSKGVNVNAKQKNGMTALHIAIRNGHEEVVKVLLEYGAKVDSKIKNEILHLSARNSNHTIIETILKFGADIDSQDEHGRTALHIASQHRYTIKAVKTLLEYGSDINIMSIHNQTPIDFAKFLNPTSPITTALEEHIVKMKAANLYLSENNLVLISNSDAMRVFQCECEEEIARMKREKINNANISFYHILVKSVSSIAMYLRNENIVTVLKSDDYKTKFPIYSSMIECRFRKGLERKELLEQGNQIFNFIFNNFSEVPHVCTEKIFSYLSNEDLRILRDAWKYPSNSCPNINHFIVSNISRIHSRTPRRCILRLRPTIVGP